MLQLKESLLWILDGSTRLWDEEECKIKIAFVHSLGQKCDSVGWSPLELSAPGSEEILDKIRAFCSEHGWRARGWYERGYLLTDSPWYRLNSEFFRDTETALPIERLKDRNGDDFRLDRIRAYTMTGSRAKRSLYEHCVPEGFLRAGREIEPGGLRSCWLQDVGKYAGTQYFAIAPEKRVPRLLCGEWLSYKVSDGEQLRVLPIYERIQQLGGHLPRLARIFTDLHISLDTCYLREDMPDAAFAYGYLRPDPSFAGENDILIRADAAEALLARRAIASDQITPVYVAELPIPGYSLRDTEEKPFPPEDVLAARAEACRALVEKNRPRRAVAEKDALRILRNAGRRRKEDFRRAMPKKQREALAGSRHAPLVPYYSICEGGYLSDEYRLLSYPESLAANEETAAALAKEETKDFSAEGIVIASCPDGDKVLLTASGEVVRISHEFPEIVGTWRSLADFMADVTKE